MDVAEMLGAAGPIARRLARYEERPQQLEMALSVDRVMRTGGRLLAEAGTGVGKSFAYLVPAIVAAAERNERVVIATHTIALQEQLLGKDVPFLSGVLPAEFSVVLAKGRGNYLCLRRMDLAKRGDRELFDTDDHIRQLDAVVAWSGTTHDGTRQDLPFTPDGRVWSKVNAEAGNCLGRACSHYDQCFYQAGRRRLQNAQLIVANHAFLFADMSLRKSGFNLLPDFKHLVLDEAHGVEDVAGDYLGMRVSKAQVLYLLRQLATRQGKGLLPAQGADTLLIDLVDVARRETEGFFDEVDLWTRHSAPSNLRLRTPELFDLRLSETLDRLGEVVQAFADTREEAEVQLELAARADRCHGTASELRSLVNMAREDHVYWVERGGSDGGNLTLQSAPVEVAPELTDHLWQRLKSVTLTSATLTTGGGNGFGHLAERLGLSDFTTLQAGTPFEFREQARLIADTRLPDPRDAEAFESALPDAVLRHVERTRGHAFVLFTSYQSLERCHAACASALIQSGYVVLRQGEGMPRGRMLEEFRAAPSAVLFGTDSFWQGVDVPGEALQNVIITRLPFSVPTHPLQQARTEAIQQRGGSAFGEYALPQAILKLKQGFGRLIRTRTDTGVVVVLDKRLVTMRYGKQFLAALPDVPLEVQ